MKLKIYIMHSEKRDYKNEIYKPLLEMGLMDEYFLILPLSEKYKGTYIKELFLDSDVIICDLSNANIFFNYELKVAKKMNKEIYYLINEKDKNIKKYKSDDVIKYTTKEEFCNRVKRILDSLNKKELLLERDNVFCLGKITK